MKTTFSILLLLMVSFVMRAQNDDITICHTPATEKFAMFASNKDFNKEHLSPRPYVHVSEAGGKMIKFKTPDGQEASGYVIEAKRKPTIGFLFFRNGGD